MTDFVTHEDIAEFTRFLSILNIHLKSVNVEQESHEVQICGQVHRASMPGQAEIEITMISCPLALNTLMQLVSEIEQLENIKNNSHPAVIDQYNKLMEIVALSKGDDSACDPA